MTEMQASREKLIEDFSAVIADSEALLKAIGTAGGEKAQSIRGDLEAKLQDARERLGRLQETAVARAKEAAKQADEYVHENPWQSIAIAAGVSAVVGLVIGLSLNRR